MSNTQTTTNSSFTASATTNNRTIMSNQPLTSKLVNIARFVFTTDNQQDAVKKVLLEKYEAEITSVSMQKREAISSQVQQQEVRRSTARKRVENSIAKLRKEVLERIANLRKEKSIGGAIKQSNQIDKLIASIKEVINLNGSRKTIKLSFYTKQELYGKVNQAFSVACGAK